MYYGLTRPKQSPARRAQYIPYKHPIDFDKVVPLQDMQQLSQHSTHFNTVQHNSSVDEPHLMKGFIPISERFSDETKVQLVGLAAVFWQIVLADKLSKQFI